LQDVEGKAHSAWNLAQGDTRKLPLATVSFWSTDAIGHTLASPT
jgi:hypothetical protein